MGKIHHTYPFIYSRRKESFEIILGKNTIWNKGELSNKT